MIRLDQLGQEQKDKFEQLNDRMNNIESQMESFAKGKSKKSRFDRSKSIEAKEEDDKLLEFYKGLRASPKNNKNKTFGDMV